MLTINQTFAIAASVSKMYSSGSIGRFAAKKTGIMMVKRFLSFQFNLRESQCSGNLSKTEMP